MAKHTASANIGVCSTTDPITAMLRLNARRRERGETLAHLPDGPPPTGILLRAVPFAPMAHDVFTPAELEARIRWHRRRIVAGLRHERAGCVRCWGCGEIQSHRIRGERSAWAGWVSRWHRATNTTECYCPACIAEYGWPGDGAAGKPIEHGQSQRPRARVL